MLEAAFDFADHQEKCTYDSRNKLTLARLSDNSVLKKANAVNNAKIQTKVIGWYVLRYTPCMEKQNIVSRQK